MPPNNEWVIIFQLGSDVEIYNLSLWESQTHSLLIQHRFFCNHADTIDFSLDR